MSKGATSIPDRPPAGTPGTTPTAPATTDGISENRLTHEVLVTGSQVRILLVEDNSGDRCLIEHMLGEAKGYSFTVHNVDRVEYGVNAVTREPFDVVLLDLSLPDAIGLDGFARIHAAAPEVPVIVLTGLDDDASAVRAVNEGAQDYLVKGTVDGVALKRSIRYAIERHSAVLRLRQALQREEEAVDRLGESERRFRSLVTSIPGAVYRFVAEPLWRCQFMSEAVAGITGYAADDFLQGRVQWEQVVLLNDLPGVIEAVKASASDRKPYRVEYRILHAGGDIRWVLDQGMALYNDESRFVEGVVIDITKRKVLEEAFQRLRLVEDRERIARELHDGVIQSLFALGTTLQTAGAELEDPNLIRKRLSDAADRVDEIIQELRRYVYALRPSLLGGIELEGALRSLGETFGSGSVTITVDVDPHAAAAVAERGATNHLVQAAREAVANAVRHSGSDLVSVTLKLDEGTTVLEVTDRGRGLTQPPTGAGQGLKNLKERAAILGGVLQIDSAEGAGTRVTIRMQ